MSDTEPRVHLVDGTFELFRCFHGAPRAQDAAGNEIGAARGLLWTLLKLLRKARATHLAVAFDLLAPPDRSDGSPDALLRAQGRLAVQVTRALGIPVWPAVRNQADDLLASGARAMADRARVVICTTDKDLLQCVRGDRVVLWDRIRDRVTDADALRARLGIAPAQIPDRSALVGDPSDGLPGVPGWGTGSAAKVLGHYARLEDIPHDPTTWVPRIRGAARLNTALRERWDEALLVRALATLRTDLPVPDDPERLRWQGPGPGLVDLAARLGAPEVVDKLAEVRPAPPARSDRAAPP